MITKSSGFSLIELLVVIAIIGVLSSVGLIAYNGYVDGTKQTSAKKLDEFDLDVPAFLRNIS